MKRALLVLAACGGSPAVKPVQAPPPPKPVVQLQTTWDQLTGKIVSATVTGDTGGHHDELVALAGYGIGKPLDREELRKRLAQMLVVPGVADVIARGIQRANGIEIAVEVTPQPTLHDVRAVEAGGKAISLGLGAATGGPLVPHALDELAEQLRQTYEHDGYLAAEAHWKSKPVAGGGVDVVVEVTPGARSTITSITMSGNTVAAAELGKAIAATIAVGQPVRADAVELASLQLSQYYWEHGRANVKIYAPEPVAGDNRLVFKIEEGPVFKIGKVGITGPPASEHARYLKAFGVKTGDMFKRSAIAGGRDRVIAEASAAGIADPEVSPLTKVDLAKSTIDLTLEIIPRSR